MPTIRRTRRVEGEPDQVETFDLPFLSSRIVGPGVNNKVIYDLKKRGRSEIQFGNAQMIFEVVGKQDA